MFDKKWMKITGMALSYPSTIFLAGLLLNYLLKSGYISRPWAIGIFLLIIIQTLVVIVILTLKNKKK